MVTPLAHVVASSQATRLATGFVFTAGPLWPPDGDGLFMDVGGHWIYRLVPGGQPESMREQLGGSNGLPVDLRGRLRIRAGDNRPATRREPDGASTPLAQHLGGKRVNRPNGSVTRSDGSTHVTDPDGRLPQEERERAFSGGHRLA